jgi:hypothetical protein
MRNAGRRREESDLRDMGILSMKRQARGLRTGRPALHLRPAATEAGGTPALHLGGRHARITDAGFAEGRWRLPKPGARGC